MPFREQLSYFTGGSSRKEASSTSLFGATQDPRPTIDEHSPRFPPESHAVSLSERKDQVPQGILFMTIATLLLAVSNALAKWQVESYPVGEVMFFRSLSSLTVCSMVILPFTGMAVFSTKRPIAHMARGLSQSISQTFTVIAFSLMPLAGATAISFSAPLWSALLSSLW